jgi:predicted HicB family RNase H-like nuclease
MKKDFRTAAAQFFHDDEDTHAPDISGAAAADETEPKPNRAAERKSQRVQLLVKPSLYRRAQRIAKRRKLSLNELVHRALDAYLTDIEKEKSK